MCTDDKRTVEVEGAEMLICWLVKRHCSLLVNTQHRLLTIALHVNQVPEVVIQWVSRHLLQRLDPVTHVKPELNYVAD